MLVGNDKYKVLLTVLPEQRFHCPKSGVEKRFCDLTEQDCQLMISKGNTAIQLVIKKEVSEKIEPLKTPKVENSDETESSNSSNELLSETKYYKDLSAENAKPAAPKKSTTKKSHNK